MEEQTSNGRSFEQPGHVPSLRQDITDSQYGCDLHRPYYHAVQSDKPRGLRRPLSLSHWTTRK